jgi:hypothetical protein
LRQQLAARACLRSPSRSLPAASRSGTIRRLIDDPHSAKEPCRTGSLRQGSSPSIHAYANQGHGARFSSIRSRSALCTQVHMLMSAPLIHKLAATDRRRNIRTSTATAYTPVPIVGRMDHCIWLGCDWSLDRCRIWVEEIIAACATSTASPPTKPRSSRCSASSTSATCTMPGVFLNYRLR